MSFNWMNGFQIHAYNLTKYSVPEAFSSSPRLPSSISVTQHSSSAPDGLCTLASMTPFAPFRLTENEAGWFTFNPDSCVQTTTQTLNSTSSSVRHFAHITCWVGNENNLCFLTRTHYSHSLLAVYSFSIIASRSYFDNQLDN